MEGTGDKDKEGDEPGRQLEAKKKADQTSPGSHRKSNNSNDGTISEDKKQPIISGKANNQTSTYQHTIRNNDFLSIKPNEVDLSDSLGLSDDEATDEDIFEKARRKYSVIYLDSDEEGL